MTKQAEYMENERIILVNDQDIVIGECTKKEAHVTSFQREKNTLHRAFSVFLFDTKNRQLQQQRSMDKLTFPNQWANTCCSHPLYTPLELEENDAIGVRRAAIRKLQHELQITDLKIEDLFFVTKIRYKAQYNEDWGENEIDWLLFARKDIQYKINNTEVKDILYVTKDDLKHLIEYGYLYKDNKKLSYILCPWFRLIVTKYLLPWYDYLDEIFENRSLPYKFSSNLQTINDLGESSMC